MATREQSAGRKKLRASEGTLIRRKSIKIDQNKLDRAVELLGASSETEAIDQALEMLFFRKALLASVDQIAGKGGMEDVYEGGYADELMK
ncbi:MAG TPA: hypothetical protein VF647_15525 [Longimicrobium sp.]|jgi:hypothetical protein